MFRINGYEVRILFDSSSRCLVRRAHIGNFETTGYVALEEECQGAKVGVCCISDEFTKS